MQAQLVGRAGRSGGQARSNEEQQGTTLQGCRCAQQARYSTRALHPDLGQQVGVGQHDALHTNWQRRQGTAQGWRGHQPPQPSTSNRAIALWVASQASKVTSPTGRSVRRTHLGMASGAASVAQRGQVLPRNLNRAEGLRSTWGSLLAASAEGKPGAAIRQWLPSSGEHARQPSNQTQASQSVG